jgi:maltooligosyltrehalose trehalohydrolase
MTPLLFMGQEWATSAPFQFFTDFEPGLGRMVVEGRRREFRAFPAFASAEAAEGIPDPQAESTFAASRLRWEEQTGTGHAQVLALHRALLRLRRDHVALRGSDACSCIAEAADESTVAFEREGPGNCGLLIVARLRGGGTVSVPALRGGGRPILDTEDAAFAVEGRPPRIDAEAATIEFQRPGALIVQRTSAAREPRERPAFAPEALRRVRRSFSEGGSGDRGVPASERAGGSGPPPPRSGFGEVSPEPAQSTWRAKADGAKSRGRE